MLEHVLISSKGFHALKIKLGDQKEVMVDSLRVEAHMKISQGHDQLPHEPPKDWQESCTQP